MSLAIDILIGVVAGVAIVLGATIVFGDQIAAWYKRTHND